MSSEPRIWQQRFPQACDWDSGVETGTVPELLAAPVASRRQAPAIEFRERSISYGELDGLVLMLAAGLLADGVKPGDRIALLLPNTPWHPVAFFAAARCGATVVHLSALDAPRELEHKLAATRPTRLVTTNLPGFLPNALKLLNAGLVPKLLVGEDGRWGASEAEPPAIPQRDGVGRLDALMLAPPPSSWPRVSPDDVMLLQFTGGTTGLPKAAMLTHGNLVSAVNIYRLWTDTNMNEAELTNNTICQRETGSGGSWTSSRPGETTACSLSFTNSSKDDLRVSGGRGIDWAPASQHFGP